MNIPTGADIVFITILFGVIGWGIKRIFIEPLDKNTESVEYMAKEFHKFNEGQTDILCRIDNIQDSVVGCKQDIEKCNQRITKLAKAVNRADAIL